MKTNYTFTYFDIFSFPYLKFSFFVVVLILVFARSMGKSGFLLQVIPHIENQPVKVQRLVIKIQKLLHVLGLVNVVFLNCFIIIVSVLWGRIKFTSQARQYARIEYLTRFDNQILLELHEKNQLAINSSFAQAIIKNDQRVYIRISRSRTYQFVNVYTYGVCFYFVWNDVLFVDFLV